MFDITVMNKIIEYFTTDPLRILYFLGGTGGVWFWIGQWRDRIRLKVRIIKEGNFINDDLDKKSYLRCEIENIGGRTTSLQATVFLEAYPPKRQLQRYEGKIAEPERDLPPHKQKTFTIDFNAEDIYHFLLFRKYIFRLTRGFSKSLRVRSASLAMLSPWRFTYDLLRFKWFGIFHETKNLNKE